MSDDYSPPDEPLPPLDDEPYDGQQYCESAYAADPEKAKREAAREKAEAKWWNKKVAPSPWMVFGFVGVVTTVAIAAVYFGTPAAQRFPAQQPAQYPSPPAFFNPAPAPGPAPVVVEPGTICKISNLRRGAAIGFGGLGGFQFDYQFAPGQPGVGAKPFVVVVTCPNGERALANAFFLDGHGTMKIVPAGLGDVFPPGTTVYLGDQLNNGPAGLPKRLSNLLMFTE